MRPVDLIPAELRQGAHAPMRTGAVPYILLGTLVAVLAAVALLVLTGNQISEQKSELTKVKREDEAAQQQAARLSAYVQFQQLHEERVATISSLADSRFDWERVMRELSLVLPHDVWLTNLKASAGGGAEAGEASASGIAGPSLELSGCATGQESVAGFVTALKDIDGVTRVGVQTSELAAVEEGGGGSGESAGSSGACQTRSFIAQFQMVVAFDAAPVPLTSEGEAAVTATETAEATSSETESSETESSEGG
jgi:Tfp pilus assembly protein PilN